MVLSTESSQEEQLLEFLYACPVGLIECDRAGDIRLINAHAMQHLLPLGGPQNASNLFQALERHAPEVRNLIEGSTAPAGRICDNHRIFVELGQAQGAEPQVIGCSIVKLGTDRFMITLADLSAQIAQERRLQQVDTWFAALIDDVNDYAVLTINCAGRIESCNRSFTRQTGHACDETVGRPLGAVLDDEGAGASGLPLTDQLRVAERDGWFLEEGWQTRKNGGRYWCQRLIVARMEHGGTSPTGFSVVLRDVARQHSTTDDVRRLLTCDHLTGAANRLEFRRGLDRVLFQWREVGQSAALVMLDLDHFKRVNDAHGHPVGDQLLRQVVAACRETLRPCDLLARLGGEEFGILLPGASMGDALAVAERLRRAVEMIDLVVEGVRLRPTASLGCAVLAESGGSIDGLIRLADQRLYAAKHAGRNRIGGPDLLEGSAVVA